MPASFNAPTGANIGYKIYGTSAGAGVETENLVTEIVQNASISSTGKLISSNLYNASIAPITAGTTYTLLRDYTTSSLFYAFFTDLPAIDSVSYDGNRVDVRQSSVTITAPITGYVVLLNKEGKSTVAEGNTAIPHGYKIPLTVETDEQTQELSVYIGDSKLSETEYVDSESGKIYKLQDGALTPTDPPAPFPAITVSGETTITTTETLGDVELTGDWAVIMGSTEQSELEIGLTVDADSYIAMLTVDDTPTIQVFDTFTIPSSAGSFKLQVVSWGREQYTDIVYNALT